MTHKHARALALGITVAAALGLPATSGAETDTCTMTVHNRVTGQDTTYTGVAVDSGATSQADLLAALVRVDPQATDIELGLVTITDSCVPATSTSTSSTTATLTNMSSSATNPTTSTAPATTTDPTSSTPTVVTTTSTAPATTTTTTSTTTRGTTSTHRRTTTHRTTTTTTTSSSSTTTSTSSSTTPTTSARPGAPRNERSSSRGGKAKTAVPPLSRRHPHATTNARHHHHRAQPLPHGHGVPTTRNPSYSLSLPGAPAIGVPNFFIESFQIPPFLLPIYQAAGIQYQVPWQVLAAINEIETDYGRNLSVSSAGAVGWMQFMPSTWQRWGVDANGDGVADPYNPVDAIFSAARYLHAAGASQDLPQAIFAYNHADWYVQSVLLRAKLIGGMPSQLIGALTGLVEGHFPVAAPAKYADDGVLSRGARAIHSTNAADTVQSDASATDTQVFAHRGAPVIAVNDGKIVKLGRTPALGRYIELQDATGNVYTYSHLGSIAQRYAAPRAVRITRRDIAAELATPKVKAPTQAATAGHQRVATGQMSTAAVDRAITAENRAMARASRRSTARAHRGRSFTGADSAPMVKERLFAHPARRASYAAGGNLQLRRTAQSITSFDDYFADTLHLARGQYTLKRLKVGSIVIAGTILGRIGGPSQGVASHLTFAIRPAGKNAPQIDPKPILDGWKLLQATAVYRANDIDPFAGTGKKNPTVGQVLLMSKQQLTTRVLTDPHARIYNCGRRDIQAGTIDRRILAVIEFLSASGLDPTVTGLACDASPHGTTGVDAAGRTGESVDISAVNGTPILGHQGPGSITDVVIRRLLTLQGALAPDDIVSDMSYKGQPSTIALPDHQNRIQITYTPAYGANRLVSGDLRSMLRPGQWTRLIDRIGQIPEPVVPISPSRYAIRDSARR